MSKKPRVCIIGSGISGLVSAKECKEAGLDVTVYEMMPVIGGVYAHYGWKEGHLTSSSIFTWFSDFPVEDEKRQATKHLTWPEWLDYLQRYVDKFETGKFFKHNCKVEAFERAPEGGWNVLVHQKNWSNGHWTHPEGLKVEEKTFEEHFDVLVVGTGLHNIPNDFSMVPGIDSFVKAGGNPIHSSKFRGGADYKGKRVVVVGAGESASDISRLCAQNAEKVAISIRGKMGTLFPHRIGGDSADTRDNRLIYSMPRMIWPFLVKTHARFYRTHPKLPDGSPDRPDEFEWAAATNTKNVSSIFTCNACKSFGIPQAIVNHGASLHTGIEKIEGKTVHFCDGTKFENATDIIFATGYKTDCAAMVDTELKKSFHCPRSLWKNMCAVGEEDIFLLGFCRSHQINIITCCEMQARAMVLIITGQKSKPSAEAMQAEIDAQKEHMAASFMRGCSAMVDFIYFSDGLADFIGCMPNMTKIMLTDPKLWYYMVFGALNGSQYRLTGPGAKTNEAREVIVRTPLYRNKQNRRFRDTVFVWLGMVLHTASIFTGNKKYRVVGAMSKNVDTIVFTTAAVVAVPFLALMARVLA